MRRILAVETADVGQNCQAPGDSVRLDHDQRTRRRIVYTTQAGRPILLDMPRAVRLKDGDLLRLEDGTLVRVEAIPEAVLDIHAHSAAELVRIAWHLGNRHLPTQLLGATLRIRYDHVIAEMVEGLGGHCHSTLAPFDPEGGAYEGGSHGGGGAHHHSHDHHEHAHG